MSLLADADEIDAVKDSVMHSFVKANPNAVANAFIISPDVYRISWLEKGWWVVVGCLNKKVQNWYYARRIAQNAALMIKPRPVPRRRRLRCPDTTGKMISLKQVLKDSMLVRIFGQAWCMPCRKENSLLWKKQVAYH